MLELSCKCNLKKNSAISTCEKHYNCIYLIIQKTKTMDENYKPKSFEERQEESRLKDLELKDRMHQVKVDTMKWLQTDTEVLNYMKQFNPSSVNWFFEHYAHKKSMIMEYGDSFAKITERKNLEYYETATKCLKLIQLKKLYDLRRQWGAWQINIEEIESGIDFFAASENVLNVSFLPPITNNEINLFVNFLKSANTESSDYNYRLYTGELSFIHTVEDTDDTELGAWFEYHNLHTGNQKYLLLPDTRGNKEMEYWNEADKEETTIINKKIEAGELPKPPVNNEPILPMINFNDDDFIKIFIKKFENNNTYNKYLGYISLEKQTKGNTGIDDDYLNQFVEETIEKMLELENPLPIKQHSDWRMAIYITWNEYERDLLLGALVSVYEDYLFRIQNKISFPISERNFTSDLVQKAKSKILKGRELRGEPRNFDFLN